MPDRTMIDAAANRAPVFVFAHSTVHRATLVAWNPKRPDGRRRNGRAVVEFRNGKRAQVRHQQVTLIKIDPDTGQEET